MDEIAAYENKHIRGVLRGLLILHEDTQFRERRLREQAKAIQQKLGLIESQRIAIRALPTPIVEVWEGILCLPLVGDLDDERNTETLVALTEAVGRRGARSVVC